jgi:hypothetical protein
MSLDHSVQGAKHQSFERDNPRELLRRIVGAHPKADEEELFELFKTGVENGDADYLNVILKYWFTNNYNSLLKRARHASSAERRAQTDAIKSQIIGRLLDLVMPNGKTLSQCTGADCRRLGGAFSNARRQGPAAQDRRRDDE